MMVLLVHPIKPDSYEEINNFYTSTIYDKGAEVIRMLYRMLGKEGFLKGMDCYFKTFDEQAVRTEDFLWAMETANIDLSNFSYGIKRVVLMSRQNTVSCHNKPSKLN